MCVFGALTEICFDCVLVLCFVMGYVLQFVKTAHKRHYHYYVSAMEKTAKTEFTTARAKGFTALIPKHGRLIIDSYLSVHRFPDPRHSVKTCLGQWAERDFRFNERYIRKDSQARKSETTQCHTAKLKSAMAK